METSDSEVARRVLSAVLERLNGNARANSDSKAGATSDLSFEHEQISNSRRSSVAGDGSPIIVVVVNQEISASDLREQTNGCSSVAVTNQAANPALLSGNENEARGLHPGLERFPIAEGVPAASAPKNCFMEPGRVCVNSGACEMRGF
jgi:hypothetical protein